ncbi:MAG: hypothetical protein HYX92_08225 [Chloroflexi bacterium]|nr:hypothetical protein [Chloroflexota bacterium]
MSEATCKVVWPLGETHFESATVSPPVTDLNGKTVCEVWDEQFRGDEVFAVIREKIQDQYHGVRFVGHEAFGNTHGPDEKEVLAALPDLLRKCGCDVVISATGA